MLEENSNEICIWAVVKLFMIIHFTCLLEITALRAKIKELSDELSNQVKYD
jgi:hypothetical protein